MLVSVHLLGGGALCRTRRARSSGLALVRADPHLAALRAQGGVDGIAKGMGP